MDLDPRRTAVLACHWQVNVIRPEGFFGSLLAEPVAASGVVARARAFHTAAREAGLPLVFTRFTVPEDEGALCRNTGFMRAVAQAQEAFRPEAPGAALVDDVGHDPQADTVSDNQRLSGLAGTDLPGRLAALAIDTVLITGVATNLTVEQTARHATDLGLHAVVVADCVAAADPAVHEASLANLALASEGCLTAAEVFEALAARSA
jgi:nicotinamidase-related amidase